MLMDLAEFQLASVRLGRGCVGGVVAVSGLACVGRSVWGGVGGWRGAQQAELPSPRTPPFPSFLHQLCVQTLYNAMLENNCSEQSSRMSAMENSTKNAGEMLGKVGGTA